MWRTLRPSAGQAQQWVSEWVVWPHCPCRPISVPCMSSLSSHQPSPPQLSGIAEPVDLGRLGFTQLSWTSATTTTTSRADVFVFCHFKILKHGIAVCRHCWCLTINGDLMLHRAMSTVVPPHLFVQYLYITQIAEVTLFFAVDCISLSSLI